MKKFNSDEICTKVNELITYEGHKTIVHLYYDLQSIEGDVCELDEILSRYPHLDNPLKMTDDTVNIIKCIEKLGLEDSDCQFTNIIISEQLKLGVIIMFDKEIMTTPIKAVYGVDCDYAQAMVIALEKLSDVIREYGSYEKEDSCCKRMGCCSGVSNQTEVKG